MISGVVITAGGLSGTSDSQGSVVLRGDGTRPTSLTATLNGVDVLLVASNASFDWSGWPEIRDGTVMVNVNVW